jgi:GNAT superfamily N-acetyltransferase
VLAMTTMTEEKSWVSSRYSPEDALDRVQLLQKIWGDSEPIARAFQDWHCHMGPGGPAIAAIAREPETGQLIGQAVTVPIRMSVADRPRTAGLSLGPVTDPAHQDRDMLVDLLREACTFSAEDGIAFSYAFPDNLSHSTFVHKAGFKDIGSVPLLIRPLNPERLALKTTHGLVLKRTSSFVRRIWRTSPAASPRESPPDLEIAQIGFFDDSFDVFWERVRHRFPIMVVRDPAYLNWRFADVPTRVYTTFAARSDGQVRGFAVLRVAPFGRFSAGMIVDLVVEASAEGRAAGRVLVDRAYSYFGDLDVDIIASLAPRHTDEFRLLRSRGFWVCPKFLQPQPFRLVVRCYDEGGSTSHLAHDLPNWFVTLGDSDVV